MHIKLETLTAKEGIKAVLNRQSEKSGSIRGTIKKDNLGMPHVQAGCNSYEIQAGDHVDIPDGIGRIRHYDVV